MRPPTTGDVDIDDLREPDDPTFDVDGGRPGLCIDAMKDDVAVETVYGAVDRRGEGCGLAIADGKVRGLGDGIGFKGRQRPVEATFGSQRSADVANILEIDAREGEIAG